MSKARILFMGTGDIALPSFRALLESEYELLGLVTQPDRPVGRKQVMTPPQIKTEALEAGLTVWQPEKLRGSEELDIIEKLEADLIVVMAYGQILPKRVIEAPKLSCINLHASLLPKYRGASCIQGAIANGDMETGVTVMHVSPPLDEGDIILQHRLIIEPHHTGGVVHDLLADVAAEALTGALVKLLDGSAERHVQDDELSTYAPKLLRNDGEIDWSKSAVEIERLVRAYDPWPGTSTSFVDQKGKKNKLKLFPQTTVNLEESGKCGEIIELSKHGLKIACGEGSITFETIQPEGKGRMSVSQYATGTKLTAGDILGEPFNG